MESTLIRGFVLLVALTGFGASRVSSKATTTATPTATSTAASTGGLPLCLPSNPTYCGMD